MLGPVKPEILDIACFRSGFLSHDTRSIVGCQLESTSAYPQLATECRPGEEPRTSRSSTNVFSVRCAIQGHGFEALRVIRACGTADHEKERFCRWLNSERPVGTNLVASVSKDKTGRSVED